MKNNVETNLPICELNPEFYELIELASYLHAYAFPPTMMIPSVLDKISQSQCRIVLIAPLWPQQAWFSEVLQLLVSAPVRLPLFPNLLTQAKGKFQHQNLPALNLHAWELSNNQLEIKNLRKTLQILSLNQIEDW